MNLNEKIREYIKANGIKQTYIAEKIDMEDSNLSQILHNQQRLFAVDFLKICAVLKVDPKIFMNEEE